MSILAHPSWWIVREFLRVEPYIGRESGLRLEIKAPVDFVPDLLNITTPCVRCGEDMHPIRMRVATSAKGTRVEERGASGCLYFAAACPVDVNPGCCRGKQVRVEIERIAAELQKGDGHEED